ncbi:MAG: ABC transporter ATP-binding protein [Rhodospirillales bacterium]|jgi:branched-chain amino acid transport system ATP-binding protein|nr:ABC transporter ATP-binding protein [Rhodospirillales bacterium]
MLSLRGLDVRYGRAQVLTNVDLEVGQGQVVALLGRNGAGKSTLLRTVMGLLHASAGQVAFDGRDLRGQEPYRICRSGLGYVPEDRRVFTRLTVAENLDAGRLPPRPGLPEWTPRRLYEIFPNLAEIRDRPGGQISGGEQQMLTIARTLMGNPAAVLLDEPSEGLAPRIVGQMTRMIGALKEHGLSILLAEQNLRFASQVAEQVYVIETGRILWHGAMADFLADADLQRSYLWV